MLILRKGLSPWLNHGLTLGIYCASAINIFVNDDMRESMKPTVKIANWKKEKRQEMLNNNEWIICLNYWVKHSKKVLLVQSKLKSCITSGKKKQKQKTKPKTNTEKNPAK